MSPGHGWVLANADGTKAECGGPEFCMACKREAGTVKDAGGADIALRLKVLKDKMSTTSKRYHESEKMMADGCFKDAVFGRLKWNAETKRIVTETGKPLTATKLQERIDGIQDLPGLVEAAVSAAEKELLGV